MHLNEPGRADWEGFATGTAALAAGGATTAVDMPLNAHPPTIDGAAFDRKRACGERDARVDFALWGGLVPGNLEAMDELAERGVVGYKAFMADSGIDDFAAADDLTLYEGMRRAAALGLPVAVHAESREITSGLLARAAAEGRTAMRDWLDSRPAVAETEAIARAIHLAEAAGCALHVVHVSTGRGVALVAEARARGADVSCETCPHYLLLTEADAERLGAVAKCAPPLRPAAELEALWGALADGSLPMVASDHSPSPPHMKEGDVLHAWGGIAGAQTTLPLVLGEDRLAARARRRGAGRLPGAAAAARAQGPDRAGRRRRPGAGRPRGARRAARRGPAPAPPRLAVRRADAARAGRAHDPARADGVRRRAAGGRAARQAGDAGMSDGLDAAIDRLAQFNDDPEAGGITREVFTPTYAEALEWVAERMRGAGLETRLDAFGNLWGRWAGSEPDAPRVITGSHVDTTLNAGRYDGVVGVLGAIEAVRSLRDSGFAPRRSLEVIAVAGEEPRFGTGCIGSRALVGALGPDALDAMRDRDGVSLAEALRGAGFDPARIAEARLDPATVHAFVELHIEQAAVLETSGEPIGVVTAIAAPHDLRLILRGAATHAGATPMALRRDALAGAAEVMTALERLARESHERHDGRHRRRPAPAARARSTSCRARSSWTSTSATQTSPRARPWSKACSTRRARSPGGAAWRWRSSRSWRTRRCSATTRWSPPPRPPARSSGCRTGA